MVRPQTCACPIGQSSDASGQAPQAPFRQVWLVVQQTPGLQVGQEPGLQVGQIWGLQVEENAGNGHRHWPLPLQAPFWHVPHEPPHPSGPHAFPLQSGVQHWP